MWTDCGSFLLDHMNISIQVNKSILLQNIMVIISDIAITDYNRVICMIFFSIRISNIKLSVYSKLISAIWNAGKDGADSF